MNALRLELVPWLRKGAHSIPATIYTLVILNFKKNKKKNLEKKGYMVLTPLAIKQHFVKVMKYLLLWRYHKARP